MKFKSERLKAAPDATRCVGFETEQEKRPSAPSATHEKPEYSSWEKTRRPRLGPKGIGALFFLTPIGAPLVALKVPRGHLRDQPNHGIL